MARYAYSPDADALVIKLRDGVPDHGEEIAPGIIAHYSRNGTLLEVEILNASEMAIEIVRKLSEHHRNTTPRIAQRST